MPVSQSCIEEILNQMKNSIYAIKSKSEVGIGFFCYIKNKDKNIPVIIINNHDFYKEEDNNDIKILKNNEEIKIEIGKARINNKIFNLSILEIRENKSNGIHFLEFDNCLYKKDTENYFYQNSIYIMKYFNEENKKEIKISSGIINNINENKTFSFYGYKNSKGSLIFNSSNNKLIGIYNENKLNNNKGILLNSIIEGFNNKYKKAYLKIYNEINITIKITQGDINKKIFFLNNNEYTDNKDKKYYMNNLNELNELNTKLYIMINKNEYNEIKFKKYFIQEKEGEYNIKLKFNNYLNDCSYMFAGCNNIFKVNFISFDTKNVKNIKYMFYGCEREFKNN